MAKRTTHRSSTSTKLYAVRSADGSSKDIQTFKRGHVADLRATNASEAAAAAPATKSVKKVAKKSSKKTAAKPAAKPVANKASKKTSKKTSKKSAARR